jgi:CHAT domain-containing protein/tetratricopeptide (TPR) repeat protein
MALRRMWRAVVLIALVAVAASFTPMVTRAQVPDDLAALQAQVKQLYNQGNYTEAVPIAERYVALARAKHGEAHAEFAEAISWLAGLDFSQDRYAEAEPLYKRTLAIFEKALGPEHPDVAITLNNLAELYRHQGRYAEAEPLCRRALAIDETSYGLEHPNVALGLNTLALLYEDQGRYAEAEPLHKRSLAIRESALGPDHPDVATSLNDLATLYGRQGRYAEAEPLYKRSLIIREKALGPNHPSVAISLNNLAELYRHQGRYAEAEPLMKRANAIDEKVFDPGNSNVATGLNNLAALYYSQGRYAEAEPLYQRALAIHEKTLGPDHPAVAGKLNNLAMLALAQGDWGHAAVYWQRATKIIERRAELGLPGSEGDSIKREAVRNSWFFLGLVKLKDRLIALLESTEDFRDGAVGTYRRALREQVVRFNQGGEMFEKAQWAQASEAASSLAQMAARSAKGDGALAPLVRERQDLVAEWQVKDKLLITAKSQPLAKRNPDAERSLSDRLADIDTRLAAIDARFPDYAALSSPKPASVADVQAQLRDGEALVLFLDTDERFKPMPEETFIWVVTKGDMRWLKSEFGTQALSEGVAALRCGLDATLWNEVESMKKCKDTLGAEPHAERVILNGKEVKIQVLPFDLARAHQLYKALLGPAEGLIKGKRLLIVPSGPLTSLPFNVLVTEPPKVGIPKPLAQYRKVAWLGARTAITVLPSVSSLKALRQFAKASHASKPYLGIGNPLLDGAQDDPVWGADNKKRAELARTKRCTQAQHVALAHAPRSVRNFASMFRGAQADIEQIRYQTPLPESADELCEVARRLDVPESDILLGADASETRLKDLSDKGRLADYEILHFATHGALAGQVEGLAEPGLVLTPPAKGTSDPKALERDDGFLTASEIATLKLDANWVILSACNTAGARGEGAEALSGMARAFFYAGARALLVSHWEVGSEAAVKLTTRAFAELKAHPEIGRSEAMRISMRELIEKGSPADAHPSQWAPFVVVGEGAAQR